MLVIKRRAFREFDGFTVWRPHKWQTAFFAARFGRTYNRRAKLLVGPIFGFGLFWTYGKGWYE